MKKTLIILFLVPLANFAQTVNSVTSKQSGNDIEISYKLAGLASNQTVKVNVYYSVNNSAYVGPLQKVSGDVGEVVKANGDKKLTWNVLSEIGSLNGDTKFKVEVIPNPVLDLPTAKGSTIVAMIEKCEKDGNALNVDVLFVSTIDEKYYFNADNIFYFDITANKYWAKIVQIGASRSRNESIYVLKSVPFRVSLIFNDIYTDLINLTAFELNYSKGCCTGEKLQFRNVPVTNK